MLDAYDRAKEQAKAHEVEVFHGRVAEAQFRDWLAGFLPKRYGVTSGYIVSQGQTENATLPHFDVIIYDRLEAPVLWIEDNPDASTAGASRAIPAEYVRSVLEVKAAFNSRSVSKALEHLRELDCLLAGVDAPTERFKRFLPEGFFKEIIFFELRNEDRHACSELFKFVPDEPIPRRTWSGGLILRGEALRPELSARIDLVSSEESHLPDGAFGHDLMDDGGAFSESKQIGRRYWSAGLFWLPNSFSNFAFDLVAKLNGTYQPGLVSSNHAQSWLDVSTQGQPNEG